MWLVPNRDLVAERRFHAPLRCPLSVGVDRNLDLVDDCRDFGLRFPQRFSGFLRDQLGEFGLVLANDVGEAPNGLDAIGVRMRRPFWPGGACGRDFLGWVADRPRPDFVARRRIR